MLQFVSQCHDLGIILFDSKASGSCMLCNKQILNPLSSLDFHGCTSVVEGDINADELSPIQLFYLFERDQKESFNRAMISCNHCNSLKSPLEFLVHACEKNFNESMLSEIEGELSAIAISKTDDVDKVDDAAITTKSDLHNDMGLDLQIDAHQGRNFELDEIFNAAVEADDFLKIRSILESDYTYVPPQNAIIVAAGLGKCDVVRELMSCIRIRSPISEFNAFLKAIENSDKDANCFRIVLLMLQDDRFDPSLMRNEALILAATKGRSQCLKQLMMDDRMDCSDQNQKAVISACENGHLEIVQTLLEDPKVDVTVDDNEAFILACENGHVSVVELLVNATPMLDAAARQNEALVRACRNNHTETTLLLLQLETVDPAARNNEPLIAALKNGNEEIVFSLLNPSRKMKHRTMKGSLKAMLTRHKSVNPACRGNWPIMIACKAGNYATVERLLSDKRTDPSAESNEPLLSAIAGGHLEVVKLLLSHPRVDPADQNNKAITIASYYGHAGIVELLLNDPRVDPTANCHDPLIFASKNGHPKVVELLLKDGRADPYCRNSESIVFAAAKGHLEVVKLLVQDGRANIYVNDREAFLKAEANGHTDCLEVLKGGERKY